MDEETNDFALPSNGASIVPEKAPEPLDLGIRMLPLGQEFDINTLVKGKDATGNLIYIGKGIIADYTNSKGQSVLEITTEKEETFKVKLITYNAGGQPIIAYLTLVVAE